ncbi:MAG: hypothetical protein ABI376_02730 [Caulobacteraceae bacterium]
MISSVRRPLTIAEGWKAGRALVIQAISKRWLVLAGLAFLVASLPLVARSVSHVPALAAMLLLTAAVALAVQGDLYGLALVREHGSATARGRFRHLLAVALLTATLLFIMALLALVVAFGFAYAVASAGAGFLADRPSTWAGAVDGRGRLVLGVVAALGAAGLLWVWARVSLAPAATVARGRVQVLASWPLTHRAAWPLALGNGLTVLVALGLLAPWDGPPRWLALGWRLVAALLLTGVVLPFRIGWLSFLHDRFGAESGL